MSDTTDLSRCEVRVLSGLRQDFGFMPKQKASHAHFVISQIMSKDFKVMHILRAFTDFFRQSHGNFSCRPVVESLPSISRDRDL